MMAQILKDEVRERIYEAACDEFFQKDFKSATMQGIAEKAGVSTGLIYSYFKNKEELFDEIVQPVMLGFPEILKKAEKTPGSASDKFMNIEKKFILGLFDKRREFIILMDKSTGTRYSNAKEDMIRLIEEHIRIILKKKDTMDYDDLFAHIVAGNFTESILEIARHYKDRKWAVKMLDLMARYFYLGSGT